MKKLIFGIIIALIVGIVLEPLFLFWLGYFSGWLAKIMVGENLCKAFLIAFGITIEPGMLPWIGGALAWIGSFFKSINSTIKKGDK